MAADGAGASLELIDPAGTTLMTVEKYYSWQSSFVSGGTPGAAASAAPSVVINEVFAHSDAPNVDYIELKNNSAGAIDIGGWYLSDAKSNLRKFQIPAGTTIAPGGYVVFDEIDFNPTPLAPEANDFALSSDGDQVWLTGSSGGNVTFVDAVEFGGTFNSQSIGRTPDGQGRLVAQAARTPGETNSAHRVSPLGITEVNYHPSVPTQADLAIEPGLTKFDLEFVELQNHSSATIDLSQWRLRGEVDLNFPNLSLGASDTVVLVSFDPSSTTNTNRLAAFRNHYGIDSGVTLIGGFTDALSNSFGKIALQRADVDPDPLLTTWTLADELIYDDLGPWPAADGTGVSVNRIASNLDGNAATSWTGAAPTPGSTSLASFAPEVAAVVRDNGEQLVRPDLLRTVEVVFDGAVTVSRDNLTLVNETRGRHVDLGGVAFNWDPLMFTATWDFANAPKLDAAFYSVVISDQVVGSTGQALDGNGDQAAGTDFSSQIYVAIPGDFDLDGQVTLSIPNVFTRANTGDVARTRANVGTTGRINWQTGDFNADGNVSLSIPNVFTRINSGDVAIARANVGRNVIPSTTGSLTAASSPPVLVAQAVARHVSATPPLKPMNLTSSGTDVEVTVVPTVQPLLAAASISQWVTLQPDHTESGQSILERPAVLPTWSTVDSPQQDSPGRKEYRSVNPNHVSGEPARFTLSGSGQGNGVSIDSVFADEFNTESHSKAFEVPIQTYDFAGSFVDDLIDELIG